jgi:hypothetical protein
MTPDRKAYLLTSLQYPQLTANESAIVRAWLVVHADEWDDVAFNQRVGATIERQPDWNDSTWQQAQILYQKRIDMVAYRGQAVRIVEVKYPRIDLGAMGQLLGYATLWRAEYPETTDLSLEAIGVGALIDAADVLRAHGIIVELYPDAPVAPLAAS